MSRTAKILAAKAANKAARASQTIKINDDWSIVRVDEYNWQIRQKGNRKPWNRWFYGTVQGALFGVFEKALNEQPHKWIQDLVPLARKIQDCIDRLQP